jgi:regulator of sirC expression with transglutaminase-like and TPR domain
LILAGQGKIRAAVEDTTHAVGLDPDNAVAFNNRGFLRLRLDDPSGALADLDRAIALRPGYPLALRSRGDALARLGRDSAACLAWRAAADSGAPATQSRLAACPP